MASSSMAGGDWTDQYAQLQLEEDEEGVLISDDQEGEEQAFDDRWCLVGKFLTNRTIDFDAMRHMLESLWQPGKGVYVKELDTNRYLFQFYHELDVQTVIDGSPWTFNRMQLVFHRLKRGEDPRLVQLYELDMWVQLHDLKYGFMSDWVVVKHADNYIGKFVKSDPKNFIGIWRDYLRVRVTIDINKPLKRRMKLIKKDGTWIWTTFKYEHVPIFCFICGLIGHSDRFCPRRFDSNFDQSVKPYGEWMKAATRKKNYLIGAQWLRSGCDEDDSAVAGRGLSRSTEEAMDINYPIRIQSDGDNSGVNGGGNQAPNCGVNQGKTTMALNESQDNEDVQLEDQNDDSVIILDNKRRRGPWCSGPPIIMSIFSWNCHGLGNPWAIQFLKDLVIQKQPKVVFLCETLSRTEVLERVRVSLGFGGVFSVDARGKSGGVALLWRDSDDIKVLGYGMNYIDAEVTKKDGNCWRLTGLYGEPNRSLRQNTWDQIRTLMALYALPWCIIGDLNNVISQSDKRGGNLYPTWLIDGFGNMLEECNLIDMDLCGYPYTWEKGRAKLINLEVSTSDHCPIQLLLDVVKRTEVQKKFRFENLLPREPACAQIVKDTWELLSGCSVMEKISYCGDKLLVWGKDYVGNFKDRIHDCKTDIQKWKGDRDDASIRNYKSAEARLQEGVWIDWDNNLSGLMVDYFSKLFSSSPLEIREVNDSIPSVVSDMQNALLLEPITDDEVRRALFQMHPDKSPGPDGMTPGFFQKYRSVVGSDVVSQGGMGFSRDDDDSDGFSSKLVSLIMYCVSSVTYKITHGGRVMGPIFPSRGIHQGDPLSPYLFLICGEGFSSLVNMFVRKQWLTGCRVARNAPGVSHILFADDSYIFCKANEMEVASILRLLDIYERASGQKINFEKSLVFFSNNVQQDDRSYLCGLLGMAPASENSSYLGLPCTMGRSKNTILGFLKGKMIKKIQSWETRFLSKAGKEVLIKSVAQSLPSYAMNVFLLTKEICSSLEGLMAKFWWKSQAKDSTKGVTWMSWRKLCRHKDAGGLGFRNLRDYNLAFLGKQGWHLLTNENSLVAQVYKARYFPKGNFLQAELGPNPSFIWQSILEAKDLIKMGAVRTICDGKTTSVLEDPWLPTVDNSFITTYHPSLVGRTVDCLFQIGSREWDVELIRDVFNQHDSDLILSIQLTNSTRGDCWSWSKEMGGGYTVSSAYKLLQVVNGDWLINDGASFCKKVWQLNVPAKVQHLVWHILAGCLPTKLQLTTKHVHVDLTCPMCNIEPESTTHVLFRCNFARSCWNLSSADVQDGEDTDVCSCGKEHWTKPVSTKFKINVDGALFETENRFGFGFSVRDKHGKFVEAFSNNKIGMVAPEIAEDVGVKEVLSWIKMNQLTDVEVEIDSLVVVQAIKGSVQMPSQFGFLVQDCRLILSELHNVFISFVKRSSNRVAHCIARKSCFMSGCILDELSAPSD
uniref:Reverse transcriptase n=1 Tax=Cannabis sativa TaxID=3483 RepID=A0A803NZS4_CANSA